MLLEKIFIKNPKEKEKKDEAQKNQELVKTPEKNYNLELSENLAYLLGDLQFLKNKKEALANPEEYKHRCFEAVKEFKIFIESSGAQEVDINSLYRKYQSLNSPFIVRREDPEKIAKLLEGEDINLSFDPKVVGDRGDKYANCAIWPYGKDAVSGIRNAFLEGRGMAGPLVTLMASKQNSEFNTIEKPEESMIRTGTIDREAVRIASGKLTRKDLEFIILRLPKNYFPEELKTEEEKKNNQEQIFRAFSF